MYIDRIDLSIPEEDLQSVLEAFASAASTLEMLPSVGPVDRKRYAKLGLKNEALTLQIIEVGRKNRHLIPAGMDFEKIDRDLVAREQLRTLKVILQGLLDRVSDSMLLTGVDLYAAALSMYHCLRRNADTASLKSTVAELKKGFARPSRKKKGEEPPAPAAAPVIVPLPESVTQVPDPGSSASERVPVRSASAVPPRGASTGDAHRVPHPTVRPRTSQLVTAPSLHFSSYQLPNVFSGGFMPSALMYVYPELPQHRSSGLLDPHWQDGREDVALL